MKVVKECHGLWNIFSEEKIVGRIELYEGFSSSTKTLYVNDKNICKVANQKEAIEKLRKFFIENKREIKKLEKLIEELTIGITQVTHQICIDTLIDERKKIGIQLDKLKSYDLV